MFKVVPDQLRISEGWVRCGQCDEIFDASAQLQGGENRTFQPAPVPAHDGAARETQSPAKPDTTLPDAHAVSDSKVQETVSTSAASSKGPHNRPVEPVLDDATLPFLDSTSMPEGPTDSSHVEDESAPPELSFMRGANSGSRWYRPWARIGLALTGLLLCLALGLQFLVTERDRIAAMEPGLKPMVEEICSFMECTVEPLRQIESIVIDSSSFNKVRGEVYRLNFSLKNAAPIALALPAIELSLTDVHDQPIMRRVFTPDELGLKSGVLQAATESNASLTLGIKTNGGADRIAGYRILAFYP
jgi:predicted Zn finger-like uncharacterized protein